MTGHTPVELQELVELPASMQEYWQWFLDLNNTRPAGFGISSITFTEMQAYFSLMGVEPESWEVGILRMFDSIACNEFSKQQKKQEQANARKAKNK